MMSYGFERWIEGYVHKGRIGVLAEFAFDDSFSATTQEFRELARDIVLQIAAIAPASVETLLGQDCLKYPDVTIDTHLQAVSAQLGDRVRIVRFERWGAGADLARPGDHTDPPRAPANIMRIPRSA